MIQGHTLTCTFINTNRTLPFLLLLAIIVAPLLYLNFLLEKSTPLTKNFVVLSPKEIEIARNYIREENQRQKMHNLEKFGPINEKTEVVVIICHNHFKYISSIVGRLGNIKGIENSLLIFSHKFYNPNIIELIFSIKFARVLQIFYPFSAQLFPRKFPGMDTNECRELKNENENPSQENCRVAKWTQSKHHFWWLQHFVFQKIPILANYEFPINFLQTDFYPTEDFFSVVKSLRQKMIRNVCDGCNAISHGCRFSSRTPPDVAYSQGFITTWMPDKHLGLSFNRTLWKKMKYCAHAFCNFNAHSTSKTLLHLSLHCLEKPMRVVLPQFPRVFHADCGTHKPKNCDPAVQFQIKGKRLKKRLFFPLNMSAKVLEKTPADWIFKWTEIGSGGWEDDRDRMMCLQMENILRSDMRFWMNE